MGRTPRHACIQIWSKLSHRLHHPLLRSPHGVARRAHAARAPAIAEQYLWNDRGFVTLRDAQNQLPIFASASTCRGKLLVVPTRLFNAVPAKQGNAGVAREIDLKKRFESMSFEHPAGGPIKHGATRINPNPPRVNETRLIPRCKHSLHLAVNFRRLPQIVGVQRGYEIAMRLGYASVSGAGDAAVGLS